MSLCGPPVAGALRRPRGGEGSREGTCLLDRMVGKESLAEKVVVEPEAEDEEGGSTQAGCAGRTQREASVDRGLGVSGRGRRCRPQSAGTWESQGVSRGLSDSNCAKGRGRLSKTRTEH